MADSAAHISDAPPHTGVRVVCVPPPMLSPLPLGTLFYAWVFIWLIVQPTPFAFGWANRLYQVGFPLIYVASGVFECRQRRRFNMRRQRWLDVHADDEQDAVAAEVARHCTIVDHPPSVAAVRRALGTFDGARATVVCMGAFEAPPPGDYRFEPVIVSHGRITTSAQLTAVVLVFLTLLVAGSAFHDKLPSVLQGYWVILAVILTSGVAWLWASGVRPRYLRLAPGRLQVLRYTYKDQPPAIRDYLVTPGFLCIVCESRRSLRLTLQSGGLHDELILTAARDEVLMHVCRAVLSTSPTPPLSADTLLG
jgi:hypothetical protein